MHYLSSIDLNYTCKFFYQFGINIFLKMLIMLQNILVDIFCINIRLID